MVDLSSASLLRASLRRLLATALETAQVRLEILGTEWELEKRRLFDALIWTAVALVVLALGLVMLCGLVLLLVWDGHRLFGVGAMAFLLLTLAALLLWHVRRSVRNLQGFMAATVSELKRDQAELRGKHADA